MEQFYHSMSLQIRVWKYILQYTFAWKWLLGKSHFKMIYFDEEDVYLAIILPALISELCSTLTQVPRNCPLAD